MSELNGSMAAAHSPSTLDDALRHFVLAATAQVLIFLMLSAAAVRLCLDTNAPLDPAAPHGSQ